MIISTGEKVHLTYRAMFENSTRRHFLGEVMAAEGAVCRLKGYAFVHDPKSGGYVKRPEQRTTIVDLSESGYIVNVIDPTIDLSAVSYRYVRDIGLVVTDDKNFNLNINEFGARS
ncbi:MAG: hypothetical protein OEW68_14850 [Gammaproteobacteria bacterium]|nr:hypothetical protein [Gammaproteobacteria bacterium]MDH4316109.1 hypothetical protein [Gammaproteobacteria bacterium]MDH5214741.1 hypothetical protein [Gammaproteobacteria bacterium]